MSYQAGRFTGRERSSGLLEQLERALLGLARPRPKRAGRDRHPGSRRAAALAGVGPGRGEVRTERRDTLW